MSVQQYFDSFFNVLNFGKYKGKHLIDIIDSDPKYIQWCIDKGIIEGVNKSFQDRIEKELEKHE